MRRFGPHHALALAAGLGFLHLPIVVLIAYSFNGSRLVTVWGGFSLRWYAALLDDRDVIEAGWLSLRVGFVSASLATLLGTLAAFALAQRRPMRGRGLFAAVATAPLAMPEVITGLSLLLMFVALDIGRGFWTVAAAHATLGMPFAMLVVQSRLARLDPSLAEAAQDLGAPPWRAALQVTLPAILPAVIAAWMLAFALSLDDLVIASFTTGPGATTLPMRIYSAVRLGVSPQVNAASTVMIAVAGMAVLAATVLRGRAGD